MDPQPYLGRPIQIGELRLTLPDFLRTVAAHLEAPEKAPPAGLLLAAERFLGAGLPALHDHDGRHTWLEYRLRTETAARHPPDLYRTLLSTAELSLQDGRVDDFYFVHKPPGLRVRLHTTPAHREETAVRLQQTWDELQARNIIAHSGQAVYEPEQQLFGGPTSMRSVHRIFTADSLLWLRYLSLEKPPSPVWALSLSMIRSLLNQLRITELEDRDVWDRVRWQAGRRFQGRPPEGWASTAARLNFTWLSPGRLDTLREEAIQPAYEDFQRSIAEACAQWHAEYFASPEARVGPREAAAFVLVFHWNRARLPKEWQVGICEALAQGPSYEAGTHDES
ncbi:thiopeptide-type bacteriocin biosynthesis protein [Streptomyces sp. NPDC020965]|uniref:thiopeptide-type bacteriocin biosynthesis protein n=1 Tax=Streptomyces sp. NPDC020965 TaxID=3365105 RepID=UPI0037887206